MKKTLLVLFGAVTLSFATYAQDLGKTLMGYIEKCESCTEIVMVSRGVEKRYTSVWLDEIKLEDGMITFVKGADIHRWNPAKITFIEKAGRLIRVYLD